MLVRNATISSPLAYHFFSIATAAFWSPAFAALTRSAAITKWSLINALYFLLHLHHRMVQEIVPYVLHFEEAV